MYRCAVLSIEGFIQQLAVCYVGRGYYFYVTGQVPEHKDPRDVDAKLIRQYNIGRSKWSTWRGYHQRGEAKVQYRRFERCFVLLASYGSHDFLSREAAGIRDARRVSITFAGYSVSFRGGHACVRLEKATEKGLKTHFSAHAFTKKAVLEAAFSRVPYEPYTPIRQQLLTTLRDVNRLRSAAGLQPLSDACIRSKRSIVRPFEVVGEGREDII